MHCGLLFRVFSLIFSLVLVLFLDVKRETQQNSLGELDVGVRLVNMGVRKTKRESF